MAAVQGATDTTHPADASHGLLLSPTTRPQVCPQLLASLVACLGPLSVGYVLGFSSPTLDDLRDAGILHAEQESWFSSLVTLGAIAGGPLAAIGLECVGRRITMVIVTVPFVIGWLVLRFAKQYYDLYIARILLGVAVGATSLSANVYIAETASKHLRGRLGAGFQLFINAGIFLVYLLGVWLNFRLLALAAIALPVIQAAGLWFLPETPRWLLQKGHRQRAYESLKWLRGRDFDVSPELEEIEGYIMKQRSYVWTVRGILSRRLIFPLLISVSLMVLQQFGGINALIFYASDIFASAGFQSKSEMVCVIVGAVQVVSSLLGCCLMDAVGRRLLLIIGGTVMTLSLFSLGLYYYLTQEGTSNLAWLSLSAFILYIIVNAMSWGPIPWLVMAEILPTEAKALATGIATATNWLCCFIVTKEFSALAGVIHEYGAFWVFSAVCLLSAAFTALFLPETKGKSLEEVTHHFDSR